jgi:putative FmdB family regulatory protein
MKALYDFHCEKCGETHERFTYMELEESACSCGNMAKKAITAPSFVRIGKWRSDIDSMQWAKTREKHSKKVAENEGI